MFPAYIHTEFIVCRGSQIRWHIIHLLSNFTAILVKCWEGIKASNPVQNPEKPNSVSFLHSDLVTFLFGKDLTILLLNGHCASITLLISEELNQYTCPLMLRLALL